MVTLTEKLTIAAIIIGPIVAVLITLLVQYRPQKRNAKMYALGQIISNRHDFLSLASVQAMNTIDIFFSGWRDKAVRRAWREFVDAIRNTGIGADDKLKKYNELINEMCKALGYGKALNYLDATRVLAPVLPQQQPTIDQKTEQLEDELKEFLALPDEYTEENREEDRKEK